MSRSDDRDSVSLYLHVPFCASKCDYCDFCSQPADVTVPAPPEWRANGVGASSPNVTLAEAYVAATLRRLDELGRCGLLADVPTVYVGGGTPTLLGDALEALVGGARRIARIRPDAEVSVEANPDSLASCDLDALLRAGVTRVSLGVQSFDDAVLAWLGRRHDAARALEAAAALRDSGVDFSVDLMCGVPGQSMDSLVSSVERAIETGAGHVSVYPLSVEDETPLGRRVASGRENEPDPDVAAEHMIRAAGVLESAGLHRYEVASYAKEGRWCRHNIRYWTGGAYLGVGPSASSMLPGRLASRLPANPGAERLPGGARVRFAFHETLEAFMRVESTRAPADIEVLSPQDAVIEDAMLGMRLTEGIPDSLAERAGVLRVLRDLRAAGLVQHSDGRWIATSQGWLLGNEIFGAIWAGGQDGRR